MFLRTLVLGFIFGVALAQQAFSPRRAVAESRLEMGIYRIRLI